MSNNSRVISTWAADETPATTLDNYIKSTGSISIQENWVTPPSVQYQQVTTKAVAVPVSSTAPAAGSPLPITGMAVSEAPYRANDGTVLSQVSVSFSPNPKDSNFDHVVIWFIGYNGNANPQSMTQASASPVSFLCATTKENVQVVAQSVSSSGVAIGLESCPAMLLTLNGQTTAPPTPSLIQALTTTPTGYQFQFAQVTNTADTIIAYQIWRNTSNTLVGASLVHTYSQSTNSSGGAITYQEVVPNGTVYYYFVIAVDSSNLSSAALSAQTGAVGNGSQLNSLGQLINADQIAADGTTFARILGAELQQNHLPGVPSSLNIPNPNFSDNRIYNYGVLAAGTQPCTDWFVVQNDGFFTLGPELNESWSPTYSDLVIYANQNAVIPSGYSSCVLSSNKISVKPGDVLCAGWLGWVNQSVALPSGVTGNFYGRIIATDCNGVILQTFGNIGNITGSGAGWDNGGFVPVANVYAIALNLVNLAFVRMQIIYQLNNTNGTSVTLPNNYVGVGRATACYLGLAVNSASEQVAKYGSMPPMGSSPLNYTTTTTSVFFSGTFSGFRTDNNLATMTGPYSFNCTGLSAGTKYYFYPYWDDNLVAIPGAGTNPQSVQFINGGSGSLGIAFASPSVTAMQGVIRADRIPIGNGPITVTTPTSGSGGGSAGGGSNSGTCPRGDMLVRHRELGVISVAELFRRFLIGGEHYIATLGGWTKVLHCESSLCNEWLEADFGIDSFIGTVYHPWPTTSGIVPSCELDGHEINSLSGPVFHKESKPIYQTGVAIKILVESPHLYLCGKAEPVLETHNPILDC